MHTQTLGKSNFPVNCGLGPYDRLLHLSESPILRLSFYSTILSEDAFHKKLGHLKTRANWLQYETTFWRNYSVTYINVKSQNSGDRMTYNVFFIVVVGLTGQNGRLNISTCKWKRFASIRSKWYIVLKKVVHCIIVDVLNKAPWVGLYQNKGPRAVGGRKPKFW
jgi:hypothetical protein